MVRPQISSLKELNKKIAVTGDDVGGGGCLAVKHGRSLCGDHGMKDLMYLGKEVKNSWGTVATTDRFIKEQPKLMAGFMRATLKVSAWSSTIARRRSMQ
jgi:hypothetical protein